MNRLKLSTDLIVVGPRFRKDYGDLTDLAASISRYGLIQPIVINQDNSLVSGGRRLAAVNQLGLKEIDVVYRETLSEDELHELELEENVRRKDMTWQERCKAVAEIHGMKKKRAALGGEAWGYRETGELLGMSLGNVGYALLVAERLSAEDKEVADCENMTTALRILLRRKEDEANALLAKRTTTLPSMAPVPEILERLGEVPSQDHPLIVPLSRMFFNIDCISYLTNPETACEEAFSYIISDPPYAIEMDNLQQTGTGIDVSRVAAEHDVKSNVDLLTRFIPLAYRALRSPGWMVLWCDPWQWRWLADLCMEAGFRVQRWPLVWTKTHVCINQMASKNWTKTVEFALVAAKGTGTLLAPQAVCHWNGSFTQDEREQAGHSFAKPVALWKWVYSAVVPQGAVVFDPFVGTGSSTVAAIEAGLRPFGCEINMNHYHALLERVKKTYLGLCQGNVTFQ